MIPDTVAPLGDEFWDFVSLSEEDGGSGGSGGSGCKDNNNNDNNKRRYHDADATTTTTTETIPSCDDRQNAEPPPLPLIRPASGRILVVPDPKFPTPNMREKLMIESRIVSAMDANTIAGIIVPINEQTFIVKMRLVDFFITRYSEDKAVTFPLEDGTPFVVRESYDEFIKTLKKECFDVFKRQAPLWIDYGSETLAKTTLGQAMLFGSWLLRYNILDYIIEHREEIAAYEAECRKIGPTSSKRRKKKRR